MSETSCHETRGYCRCDKPQGHVATGDLDHHCAECDNLPNAYALAHWRAKANLPGRFREQESICVKRTKRYPACDPWTSIPATTQPTETKEAS